MCALYVLLLSNSAVIAQDNVFDPIDATGDEAAFDQPHLYNYAQQEQDKQSGKKLTLISSHHKTGKKGQHVSHVSFEPFLNNTDTEIKPVFTEAIVLTPVIPAAYTYLFAREINPPPPKAC